jgi:hypothetical protein
MVCWLTNRRDRIAGKISQIVAQRAATVSQIARRIPALRLAREPKPQDETERRSAVDVPRAASSGRGCPVWIIARNSQRRMFTARAATNSTVVAEIADSASIIIFTRRVSGIASVGLNAMALVNETYT